MNKPDIEIDGSLVAMEVDGGNHKSLVNMTTGILFPFKTTKINVGKHYRILED